MKWNVLRNDFNAHEIKEYDIFRHNSFAKDVAELSNQDLTKEDFTEKLRRSLQYYFWAKSEHEVVITSWPPYIDGEELTRLNTEYEEHNTKWGRYPYKLNVRLDVREKIDIYDQVLLNWDIFVDYVWSQRGRK